MTLFLAIILVGTLSAPRLLAEKNLSWADGYKNGKQAAIADINRHYVLMRGGMLASILGGGIANRLGFGGVLGSLGGMLLGGYAVCTLWRPSAVPQNRMSQIKDKPNEYQKGYVKGYKEWFKKSWSRKCWGGAWLTIGIYILIRMGGSS